MPRKRANLGMKQNYSKESLQKAIDDVKAKKHTMRKASEIYKVPLSTLCDNVNGKSLTNKIGAKPKLNLDTEELLADYFSRLIQGGFNPTFNHVNKIISDFLQKNNLQHLFKNGCPGRDWYYEFKKRWKTKFTHDEQQTNTSNNNNNTCELSCRERLGNFLHLLTKHYETLDLQTKPDNVWCIDELSFTLNRQHVKITQKRTSKNHLAKSQFDDEKTHFTLITCCNAAGAHLPPFVIYKSKTANFDKLSHKRLPNALCATSPSGWMENEQFIYWFKEMFLAQTTNKEPKVLFIDSAASNLTIDLLKMAIEHDVNLLFLPQNCSSDPLSPIEVGLHRSEKIIWHKILDKYSKKTQLKCVNRNHLPYLVFKLMEKTFTPGSIQSGFAKTGLFPLNVDKIMSRANASSITINKIPPPLVENNRSESVENTNNHISSSNNQANSDEEDNDDEHENQENDEDENHYDDVSELSEFRKIVFERLEKLNAETKLIQQSMLDFFSRYRAGSVSRKKSVVREEITSNRSNCLPEIPSSSSLSSSSSSSSIQTTSTTSENSTNPKRTFDQMENDAHTEPKNKIMKLLIVENSNENVSDSVLSEIKSNRVSNNSKST